jgi:hypothetical protein
MATERAARIVSEARTASSVFLEAWHQLQDARDAYNAVGGTSFFDEYFSTPQEITSADMVALMTSATAIDDLMAAGHATNLYNMRG